MDIPILNVFNAIFRQGNGHLIFELLVLRNEDMHYAHRRYLK